MKFSEIKYERPNIEAFQEQFKKDLLGLKSSNNYKEFISKTKEINDKRELFQSLQSFIHINHSIDTKNEFYDEENKFFDSNSPILSQLTNELYQTIRESEYVDAINKDFGPHFLNGVEVAIKTFDESIMELLGKENEISSKYNSIIASAEVEWNGEKMTLSQLSPFATDKDRATRKKAADLSNNWFSSKAEELDELFDQLVNIRHEIALKLGYENFTQLGYDRLSRTDYGPLQVRKFRDAVHTHIVPVVNELRSRQAKRINVEQLEYYDIGFQFKSGNPTPKGSPSEIVSAGKKMYEELSPETAEFFNYMLDNELMDLESKKGKMAGGYCTYMPSFRHPYIFSNFNGTSHDIDVLTHEAGHAFQIYNSRDLPLPEYYWPTLEACEIHSMSMEFLTWNWMELFFKEDTDKYKFSHLSSGLLFLPYGVAIDEFQHWIYENPKSGATKRNEEWLKIEKKYMPYKADSSSEYLQSGRMWHKQGHLFRVPFYYIDYTLAQVCAYQFWKEYQNDKESAWNRYLALCKLGGSHSFTKLIELSGLQNPFNDALLSDVAGWVSAYLDKVDDSQF